MNLCVIRFTPSCCVQASVIIQMISEHRPSCTRLRVFNERYARTRVCTRVRLSLLDQRLIHLLIVNYYAGVLYPISVLRSHDLRSLSTHVHSVSVTLHTHTPAHNFNAYLRFKERLSRPRPLLEFDVDAGVE